MTRREMVDTLAPIAGSFFYSSRDEVLGIGVFSSRVCCACSGPDLALFLRSLLCGDTVPLCGGLLLCRRVVLAGRG